MAMNAFVYGHRVLKGLKAVRVTGESVRKGEGEGETRAKTVRGRNEGAEKRTGVTRCVFVAMLLGGWFEFELSFEITMRARFSLVGHDTNDELES